MTKPTFILLFCTLTFFGLFSFGSLTQISLFFMIAVNICAFAILLPTVIVIENRLAIYKGYLYKLILAGLSLRIVLLNVVVALNVTADVSLYGVFDDEYYETALVSSQFIDARNLYESFARMLFEFSNSMVPYTLRLLNIIFSSLTCIPLALALVYLNCNAQLVKIIAAFIALLPYWAAHSIFSIKDVSSAILLTSMLATCLRIGLTDRYSSSLKDTTLILCASMVLELLRSGQGIAVLVAYLTAVIFRSRSRLSPGVALILLLIFSIPLFLTVSFEFDGYLLRVDQYIRWIPTQLSDGDFRSVFIVDHLLEIWKIPLSVIAYVTGPFPQPNLSGRLLIDNAGWLKLLDLPLLFLLLMTVTKTGRVGLIFLAPVILPLVLSSIWNVSNFRSQVAYYPGMLILLGVALTQKDVYLNYKILLAITASILVFVLILLRL